MRLPVHRIIPFSNVEGLGNRTSIFVQGCNLNCIYCHNSETISLRGSEVMRFSVEELFREIMKNIPFIRGITVSGGEATIYYRFLADLFKLVKKEGLTCYIDTNGFFDRDVIRPLTMITDKFLFDIKGMDDSLNQLCFSDIYMDKAQIKNKSSIFNKAKQNYHKNQNLHFDNLTYLLQLEKIEEIRFVYIKGFYSEKEVFYKLGKILKPYPHIPIKLIRVHGKGLPKSRAELLKGHIPTKLEMEGLKKLAYENGIHHINYIL